VRQARFRDVRLVETGIGQAGAGRGWPGGVRGGHRIEEDGLELKDIIEMAALLLREAVNDAIDGLLERLRCNGADVQSVAERLDQ